MKRGHGALLLLIKGAVVDLLGPVAGRVTAGINFNHHLKYSDEGLLPCIVDIASGEQGSDVQGENGFTSVQKWGR